MFGYLLRMRTVDLLQFSPAFHPDHDRWFNRIFPD